LNTSGNADAATQLQSAFPDVFKAQLE
jgi:hypothetical protein